MKRNTLTSLLILVWSINAFAVDDKYESLQREKELTNIRLAISNNNLALMKNANEAQAIKELDKSNTSTILGVSGNTVFVKSGSFVKSLTVGDHLDGSTIESVFDDLVILANGKELHVF